MRAVLKWAERASLALLAAVLLGAAVDKAWLAPKRAGAIPGSVKISLEPADLGFFEKAVFRAPAPEAVLVRI